jgi:hypothetical protein
MSNVRHHMSDLAPIAAEKLKRHHFDKSPVWAYCLNSEGDHDSDESYVRPATISDISRGSYGQFLVAATFTLKSKHTLPGAVQIDVPERKAVLDPAFVFLIDRQLSPISMDTDRLLSRYTRFPGNTPRKWALQLALPGESRPRNAHIRKTLGFHLAVLVVRLGMSFLKRRLQRQQRGDA